MKKNTIDSILAVILFLSSVEGLQAQQIVSVTGRIFSASDSIPLPGATVKISASSKLTVTDQNGRFLLSELDPESVLIISFLGFQSMESPVQDWLGTSDHMIYLMEDIRGLEEVTVLSTGFQEIPKERATGSFVQVDRDLINRSVSTGLLDRLENVTPSLIFNRGPGAASDPISIRGRNTFFAETQPLIIVDNFPYDGPLENINPNDVESITILRDAAAASIWGARSGNGVIVVKTKSGSFKSPMRVTLNANVNFIRKPDLFARSQMDIGEFIGVEEQLFNNGNYDSRINLSSRPALSPVVETLIANREGNLSIAEKNTALAQYAAFDSRAELMDHFYRTAVNQQYSLGLDGGADLYRYAFSLGYDNNQNSVPGNFNKRYTSSFQNDWRSADGRLDLGASVYWALSENESGTDIPAMQPYEKLLDESGNPQTVIRDYNSRYIKEMEEMGFLNSTYTPLNEIGLTSNRLRQSDARINLSAGYKIAPWLKTTVRYQYWANSGENRNHSPLESYSTRYLINRYTQISEEGMLSYPIPMGGMLNLKQSNSSGNYLRGQVNLDQTWRKEHEIHAIIGAELKEVNQLTSGVGYYGYDDMLGLSLPVDYLTRFRIQPTNGLATVPTGDIHGGTVDRFVSGFANASYSYRKRYMFSLSARKDASNIFGVNTNQRGVPLWSTGLGWTISQESFYRAGFIPYLKLRSTFGYNGNVDKSISAFTTASYYITASNSLNPGERAAVIRNPPNPYLRWEKIKVWNAAIDFGFKNDILDGSLEFYSKMGQDLIGDIPTPPSQGIQQYRGNFGSTRTTGMDLELRSSPLRSSFRWDINFFHSLVREEVTEYDIPARADNLIFSQLVTPLEGRPLFSLYSYPWGGLDPDTGDPRGILDGEPSTDYSAIRAGMTSDNVVYHGSSRPTSFGSLRNTLGYKGLSISFNISYRLGYYFRRNTVNYVDLVNGRITHADYHLRWQQAGEELITDVPSMPLVVNSNRQTIYRYSEITAERGDHIRFQDVRIAYRMERKSQHWLPFRSAELYSYVSNLGILWKKTDFRIDPDFQDIPPPRSLALGLRIDI
ncbi:SusC/RagA family TonB-linked outer membrane protein [Algoriphagus sp. NG3]|uniref:SusC/RagA family TonB-linked outer membrane protein n=1 Tax=Algoriphagus sp. NG3 TaxID=3097546 RepID=UPI002A80CE93|nr:SusC/RagA family TonB-linked outer membrane protein [Algoriphagus sp. NG3]WPR77501.1 SusC/RagA family TonB-linked outer membrane protein [Algoriphagus sp. NG3]